MRRYGRDRGGRDGGPTTIARALVTATRRAARWHVHSHEGARRNAMVASTALTQRRIERHEVEEFLAVHRRQYDARVGNRVRATDVADQRNRAG